MSLDYGTPDFRDDLKIASRKMSLHKVFVVVVEGHWKGGLFWEQENLKAKEPSKTYKERGKAIGEG